MEGTEYPLAPFSSTSEKNIDLTFMVFHQEITVSPYAPFGKNKKHKKSHK